MKLLRTNLVAALLASITALAAASAPILPQTCGWVFGDPHLETYDKFRYDCHGVNRNGVGDYVFSKSLDSGFETQVRYYHDDAWGDAGYGTTTVGAVIKTGVPGEPIIEASFENGGIGCDLRYYINGAEFVESQLKDNLPPTVQFYTRHVDRYFYFPGSDISLHLVINKHDVFQCFFGVKLCIPDKLKTERIVGQLGNPDGDKTNEYMARDGKTHDYYAWLGGGRYFDQVNEYCTSTWCVYNDKVSLFQKPQIDHEHECEAPEDSQGSIQDAIDNASEELKKLCGDNIACLVDGTVGGISAGEAALEQERHLEGEEKIPGGGDISGGASGDPHFRTWTGDKFDFMGQCDLVLVQNKGFEDGQGLHIHLRTQLDTWWSFIESAAVRIGEEILEISGGKDAGGGSKHWINGHLVEDHGNATSVFSFAGFKVDFKAIESHHHRFRIELGNGNAIGIDTFKRFVSVTVSVKSNKDQFKGSVGLMGRYPDGRRLSRDGQSIVKDADAFGKEWQVLSSEALLFHTAEDSIQHPQACKMPGEKNSQMKRLRRRLGEIVITTEEAELACARVKEEDRSACIFDVMATQDKDMAGAY